MARPVKPVHLEAELAIIEAAARAKRGEVQLWAIVNERIDRGDVTIETVAKLLSVSRSSVARRRPAAEGRP